MNAFYFRSMNICIWLSCISAVFIWNLCNAELKTEPVFECDFEKSTCGLTNDVDHEARWERRYMSLRGRSSTMMVTKIGGKKKQIARLLSPILDGHWSGKEGCLSLDLYAAGDGITAFRVKKQDDSGVFPLIGVHTAVTKWRKYNLHVDIDDYIRFILEAHVNPELGGTLVAIDNISFKLEDCKD